MGRLVVAMVTFRDECREGAGARRKVVICQTGDETGEATLSPPELDTERGTHHRRACTFPLWWRQGETVLGLGAARAPPGGAPLPARCWCLLRLLYLCPVMVPMRP
jgi:hypothetical protein